MSALRSHAVAYRALGQALRAEGENSTDRPGNSELLCLLGDAHLAAADDLEQQIRAACRKGTGDNDAAT